MKKGQQISRADRCAPAHFVVILRNMKMKYKPLTVLRLKKLWPHAKKKRRRIGQIYRVGYYSKQDGTELIWLVDDNGDYNWTADEKFIDNHFEIIELSKARSIYGYNKPKIKPR